MAVRKTNILPFRKLLACSTSLSHSVDMCVWEMFIYFNLMRRLQKLNALLPHAHAHATPQGTHTYVYL